MGKQINQYTKTRTSGTVQNDDFLDFDSTEDSGTTFESAKITVLNFINYIKTQIPTIYSANSTLLTNRIITAAGLFTKWSGGDVIVEMDDLVTDHGFIVENSSSVEKARLGYNQTNSTALLELKNGSGTYFEANDELIDSKDGYYMNTDRVLRPDGASAWVGEDFSRLRFNPTGRVYLDKTMWVSSSQPISSSAQPSNVFIKFTNELTLSTLGKTSATTNDAMLFKSGVPVVDAVGLTETLFHFQNDGNDLLDIKANGVVKYKEFTVATLPLATSGGFIMVTDETGGYTPAFCDGTNWRRTSDNAIVS